MVLLRYSSSKLIDLSRSFLTTNLVRSQSPRFNITHQRFASKYTAAVLKKFKEPLVLEELKQKSLGAGQVRISVYCCGINSDDAANWVGELEPLPKLPFVPGYEVCGEIIELPNEAESEGSPKLKVGQRVIGLNFDGHSGGFATEMVISRKDLWRVDESMPFADGASLINSYATALLALTRRASVKEGDSILVTGAGGRLGLATVDLAANVYKCKVIGLCTSQDKASAVRDKGAWATISHGKQDILTQVKSVTDGKGVSTIIDSVGGNVFTEIVKCVEDEGKIVVAGFASKSVPQISGDDLLENSFSVHGVSLEQFRRKRYEDYREVVSEVINLAREGLIKPYNRTHFPLDKVNEALTLVRDMKSIGKIVLDIQ